MTLKWVVQLVITPINCNRVDPKQIRGLADREMTVFSLKREDLKTKSEEAIKDKVLIMMTWGNSRWISEQLIN